MRKSVVPRLPLNNTWLLGDSSTTTKLVYWERNKHNAAVCKKNEE